MITTALTDMFNLRYPIVLAPMGSVSGGKLAAAVSNAGGLGMIGGGYGDVTWLHGEINRVNRKTTQPWGVGLITWSIKQAVLDMVLGFRPAAVMLSFGDPRPHSSAIHDAGCKLICQVQDVEQALVARQAGADIIVAEGSEAGGHSGKRATLPLVPAVVDAVAPVPVVAAGGIGDGRGLAAALMLGAHGALMGTRFCATPEGLLPVEAKLRLVEAGGDNTSRTRAFDIVRGYDWPAENPGRALQNHFMRSWEGREGELAATAAAEYAEYQAATNERDYDTALIWAGEVVDLIDSIESATKIVERIGTEAEILLRNACRFSH